MHLIYKAFFLCALGVATVAQPMSINLNTIVTYTPHVFSGLTLLGVSYLIYKTHKHNTFESIQKIGRTAEAAHGILMNVKTKWSAFSWRDLLNAVREQPKNEEK